MQIKDTKTEKGRTEIKLDISEFKGTRNFYLTVWSDKTEMRCIPKASSICTEKDCEQPKDCTDKTEVMIHYYTVDKMKYVDPIVRSNLLTYENNNSTSIKLKWSEINSLDASYNITKEPFRFVVFATEEESDYDKMQSVCFLSSYLYLAKIRSDNASAIVGNLESGKKYYMNVIAINYLTDQGIAFTPIEITFISSDGGIPFFIIIIFVALILGLMFLVYHFYKKYVITNEILKYETSDVRNMSTLPKSESELKTIVRSKDAQKYAHLAEEPSSV